MAYDTIIFSKDQGIATITLNRTEKHNAINWNMYEEINQAIDECDYDDEIRVVVFKGAGKTFCSGEDILGFFDNPKSRPPKGDKLATSGYIRMAKSILEIPKPVIASINGHAIGAGFELCLACDYKIALEKAKFSSPLVNLGLSAFSVLLPKYVGLAKAKELLMLGIPISATEAKELGIINKVVAPDNLVEETSSIAKRFEMGATKAIGFMKKNLNRGISENYDYEVQMALASEKTEDAQEAIKAFAEKRNPIFKGR